MISEEDELSAFLAEVGPELKKADSELFTTVGMSKPMIYPKPSEAVETTMAPLPETPAVIQETISNSEQSPKNPKPKEVPMPTLEEVLNKVKELSKNLPLPRKLSIFFQFLKIFA